MADDVVQKMDSLANAVGQGFKEMNEHFRQVEGRMENVEGRLENIEQKANLVRTDIAEFRFDYKKMFA